MPALLEQVAPELDTKTMLAALSALRKGDFSVRLPVEWTGVAGKVADTFNEVVELNERMAKELDVTYERRGNFKELAERAAFSLATTNAEPGATNRTSP